MRVLMISPYDDRCYGARNVAAYLRERGHEVWLIIFKQFMSKEVPLEELERLRRDKPDGVTPVTETLEEGTFVCSYIHPANKTEWQLLLDKVGEIRPDIIGLTLNTSTAPVGREITAALKREFPRIPVVWGGVHPTIDPESCIHWTDMVCIGEGEHVMEELAEDPERTDVLGLWRNVGDKIVRNPLRPLEQNLDSFPFALWGENEFLIEWSQVIPLPATNRNYFRGIYFTMTQRGCPFACSYCYNSVYRAMFKGQRYVRRRSVDHSLDECEKRMRDFDLPGFAFMDDVFVKDREWLEEFAEKYPRRIGLPFGGYVHPLASTEEMIRLLVEAGMRFITIGVQSGSDYITHKVYNRPQSFEQVLRLAQWGEKYGLDVNYDLLSNCEFESEKDCRETLEFMTRLPKPRLVQVKGLGVFPSTRIASLDLPKHNLPEKTFEFWNTLYLMTRHREIPAADLIALSEDNYLKEHPETLRAIALAFKRLEDKIRTNREEAERLAAEENEVSLHGLVSLAKQLAKKHLPQPVVNALRTLLGRNRRAAAEAQN